MEIRFIRVEIACRIKELERFFNDTDIKWEPHHEEELERLRNMLEESYQVYK